MILFTKIEHIVINNTSALIITQNFAFFNRRQILIITIQVHKVMMQKSVKQTCAIFYKTILRASKPYSNSMPGITHSCRQPFPCN